MISRDPLVLKRGFSTAYEIERCQEIHHADAMTLRKLRSPFHTSAVATRSGAHLVKQGC
jgi:hypothetical protein